MSEQFYPTVQAAPAPPVVYAQFPSQVSVWRIAAATFVGILLCQLLSLVVTACVWGGIVALGLSAANH